MSIILKGIDIPKSKDNRYIIQIYNDGEIHIAEEVWDDTKEGHDKLQRRYIGESKAIQIPKGHGRLIDGDALELEKEVELADDWKTAHEIANCVKYAPTILEAET